MRHPTALDQACRYFGDLIVALGDIKPSPNPAPNVVLPGSGSSQPDGNVRISTQSGRWRQRGPDLGIMRAMTTAPLVNFSLR